MTWHFHWTKIALSYMQRLSGYKSISPLCCPDWPQIVHLSYICSAPRFPCHSGCDLHILCSTYSFSVAYKMGMRNDRPEQNWVLSWPLERCVALFKKLSVLLLFCVGLGCSHQAQVSWGRTRNNDPLTPEADDRGCRTSLWRQKSK